MNRGLLVVGSVLVVTGIVIGILLLPPLETPVGNLALETLQGGLANPVSFAFAPDGRLFFNELRTGGIRIIKDGVLLPRPFHTVPVLGENEMGLLGLALHPNFAAEPYVYVFYTHPNGPFNRISRFPVLGDIAGEEEVLLDQLPSNAFHNGGRLEFGPDGMLYASLGDTGDRAQSQNPQTPAGTILRLRPNGSRPTDNPFLPSYTYLYGIRNVFGLAFTPSGKLLFTENGPRGDDEVNRGVRGGNYGWPVVQGDATDDRFVRPILAFPPDLFSPSIAPTGIAFYTGDRLGPAYGGAAYFGSWNRGSLRRIVGDVEADAANVTSEVVLTTSPQGLLDVVDGPDGHLYVSFPDRIARVVLGAGGSMAPALSVPWMVMAREGSSLPDERLAPLELAAQGLRAA